MLQQLRDYVAAHTARTACRCGKCLTDGPGKLEGHTADLVFFEVSAAGDPDADELRRLVRGARHGEFIDLEPLDGNEHSYLEIGSWIGDQGLAMQLMGLGTILGLWNLMTPKMLGLPAELVQQMAGMGMVSIMAKKEDAAV